MPAGSSFAPSEAWSALPLPPPLRADLSALAGLQGAASRADEVDDVSQLLLAHLDPAAGPAERGRQVAHTVAVACLGDDHLWQDLGFQNRQQLGAMLRYWFPALVAKNTGDMKWKKFFYRQLCEAHEVLICKSPSCAVCQDYVHCFEAPEPASSLTGVPIHLVPRSAFGLSGASPG